MTTTATKDLEKLETDYRRRRLEIRANPELSWEKKELKVRELGLKYDRERKETERSAA